MKRNRIYITAISGLLLISLTIGSFSSVQAENPPGNPYSVYGYVTLNGNPAPADVKIILSIPNRADHTGLTNAKGQYTVDFDAVQGETASFTVYVYNQYVHPTNTLSFKITNPSPHGYFINLSVTVSGGNNPPNVPSNPFPALGATGVPIVTFLSWIGGDPDAADTVTYDVYFGTTNPPPIKTHDQSGTTYNPSPLTYNTTYYWMAVSWDNHGASTIGPIWSFTTGFTQNHCPDKPQNPSPLNGTTGVVTNPTLSVTVTDPDGGLLNVRFYNAANNILIGMTYALDGNTASVIWSGLAFDTTYHWYTIANDSWLENTSDTWGFTTKSSGDGGDGGGGEETLINKAPIADASAGEPYQGYVNQQITFDGSKSYDPDGKIMSWSWTFGDGNSGTGEVTTHIYTQVGSHMVVLTVTDNKSATGTDYTTAVVTIPNSPPTTPTLTGGPGVLGHKNISYDFQTVSTDADNDMIKYIFSWDDGQTLTTDFFASGIPATQSHIWSAAGRYVVSVKTSDNKTESGTISLAILIDAQYVGDYGYLIDTNGDGIYDLFYSDITKNTTTAEKQDGSYLIDTDGIAGYDQTFNPDTGDLTDFNQGAPSPTGENSANMILLGIIVAIVVLLLLLFLLGWKKKDKSADKPVETQKIVPPTEKPSEPKTTTEKTTKKKTATLKKPKK